MKEILKNTNFWIIVIGGIIILLLARDSIRDKQIQKEIDKINSQLEDTKTRKSLRQIKDLLRKKRALRIIKT